ncbi:hypothetical protein BD779DRAFT_1502619 [Infundibulicybe gibba]|nr:hypothetical protein BD779DRAFT_1502619 [Infundibulicybe gibba]
MGWLASLFSSEKSQSSRKGQALSSTHEAFSLPTSSPILSPHPDAFHHDVPNTPDTNQSYTYPPQGSGPYGYVPTSAGLQSRGGSLLPMHHDRAHTPLSPTSPYPPLAATWNRLRAWLGREYPELGDTLNYGILPQDLALIENQFGFALPAVVRESFLTVDGQEAESSAGCSEGLFFGLTLLPLEYVLEEWKFWREVDEDSSTGANDRLQYSQRGWIPLITDKAGNYIGVDLNPDQSGSVGQVIVFGREFDTKVVLWKGDGPAGWAKWLASFVEELESGEGYEIGTNEPDEGSEDDLGYESYFYDGSGRGQGDGGGDTTSGGGLRLTGEYRGWNVLEAWADRSLRKWHQTGVIPDSSLLPAQEDLRVTETVGLGVIDLPQGSGTEVPIPVLADTEESTPPPPHKKSPANRPTPLDLPTISITKPPAPRPVELPTPRDIGGLPSPPESIHSAFDEDLESGRNPGMREVTQEAKLVSSRRKPSNSKPQIQSPVAREAQEDSEAALLESHPPGSPYLLADSGPALHTIPIEPSSPNSILVPTVIKEAAPSSEDVIQEAEAQEDNANVDNTIRLIGGGGVAGVVDSPLDSVAVDVPQVEPEPVATPRDRDSDVASINSVTSETGDSKKAAGKSHKKTKSGLAGLRKFGHLSGLRKKDSSSSAKDIVAS